MSNHDSSQPGSPRRKLVLRKITPLGPLPEVKPPPRPSMPSIAAPSMPALAPATAQGAPVEPIDVTDLAQAEDPAPALDELETPTSAATVVIPDPRRSASFRAAAIAEMARTEAARPPPIPSSPGVDPADLYGAILKPMPTVVLVDAVPAGRTSGGSTLPQPMFDTTPSTPVPPQTSSRVSVLPFVASVSVPPPAPIDAPVNFRQRMGRMPAFVSRGGWLAAAVLVVVMGVVAGEQAAVRLRAAAGSSVSSPIAAAAATAATIAPAAVEPATPAGAPPVDVDSVIPEMAPIPTIVLRSELPAPRKAAHAWTVPANAPSIVGAADGWTVAPTSHAAIASVGTKAKAAPASAAKAGDLPKADDASQDGAGAPPAESLLPAPPPVDPLMQAIREDIREDESQK